MRILDGDLILSPSDLTGFSACEHLTRLELRAARGEIERPIRDDPLLDVLSRRGGEHEQEVLDALRHDATNVVTIDADASSKAGLERAAADTEQAMRAGASVIYQATFFHGGWVGHADFVERVDAPSALGAWSYEVADAKLARSVKTGAVLQLCAYSEHVARIQGQLPELIHVLTGDGKRHSLRLADYAAYYRALKERFAHFLALNDVSTYPERVQHCSICRWAQVCASKRRDDDHLSLVAGMRRDQIHRLGDAGIPTRAALAVVTPGHSVDGVGDASFERLRHQADLQVRGAGCLPPLYDVLEPMLPDEKGPQLGFAALPPPSPGDLYLDLEGDPYALDGGLEYLFGIVDNVNGTDDYHEFWAHDRGAEKLAFEAALDFIVERRARHPDLHVYHYAPYEPTAFKRLMGAHGTRESELDDLLRGEVFVDLYKVVRNAVRLSTESYSLKAVEKLYTKRADGAVMDAGSSIVAYEEFLASNDPAILAEIAAYNRDDCTSLVGLQSWLEERRVEAEAQWGPIPRPRPPSSHAPEELTEREARLAVLSERLTVGVPDDPAERTGEQHGRWLLAQLLNWHRREDKPKWWMYFHRVHTYDAADFVGDTECIGGLTFDRVIGPLQRSVVYRYRFEPQEHKLAVGDSPDDPATEKGAGEIVEIGDGYVDLKRGPILAAVAHPEALVPNPRFSTKELQEAIAEVGAWVADHGIDAPGPYRAARDLLLRVPPRFPGSVAGEAIATPGEDVLEVACRVGLGLEQTCLPIQGPPGAGKTFTGAHMVAALLDDRRRVGVTASSHSAITNFLEEVCKVATEQGVAVRAMQKTDEGKGCADGRIECVTDNDAVYDALAARTVNLVAGTPWLWARSKMREAVDVLFVDEAGQMSLANVVAVAMGASSLVLLGDPQQLGQPSQGSHPDGSGLSAIGHLLGEHETMPPAAGLFLDQTWRMHPNVCEFISEIAYEGKLGSAAGRELQVVDGFAGLRFLPVDHADNRVRSTEEAVVVATLIRELVGRPWTDHDGKQRNLQLDDIIVIAPYNAHVAELRDKLTIGARIGTVDKFQGQEGAVAIYSMASSSSEDAPRGMNFLYDLHRLNVAVSRARAIGVVVCSPALLRVRCQTPEQIRLANALCRFVECASPS
ncbi:MAG TPA: TM0106 family RecB-like putative nuclease [Acidimicrobiales bacterium]|nr:TM0106 family RecB-like putative nuclease [Acidimicrobiales bacterium]